VNKDLYIKARGYYSSRRKAADCHVLLYINSANGYTGLCSHTVQTTCRM